jgi:hypothetical protein
MDPASSAFAVHSEHFCILVRSSNSQGCKWFFKKIPEIFWQIFPKAKSDMRFVNRQNHGKVSWMDKFRQLLWNITDFRWIFKVLGDILWPYKVVFFFFFLQIGNPTLEETRRNTGILENTGQLSPLNFVFRGEFTSGYTFTSSPVWDLLSNRNKWLPQVSWSVIGIEPTMFGSAVRRTNHKTMPACHYSQMDPAIEQ